LWRDIVGLSFGALSERKLRSALTILMVLIGATLMTSLSGLNGGMQVYINDQLSVLGGNLLIVTPSPTFERLMAGGAAGGSAPVTLNDQTVKTIKAVRGVAEVVPFYSDVATMVSKGVSRTVSITGIDQNKMVAVYPKLSLQSGTLLSPSDSIGIVLGSDVSNPPGLTTTFAGTGGIVSLQFSYVEDTSQGQKTVTSTRVFQVKGTLNSLGSAGIDSGAFITLAAANALFQKGSKYSGMYVVTRDPALNDQVESTIKKIYADNIGVVSPKTIATTIEQLIGGFTSFITSVAAISMLVGGVGIVTTLYTSVMERTREIGLLKALGFRNSVVMTTFLLESALIGLIGGIVGIVAGIGGAQVLTQLLPFGPTPGSFRAVVLPSDILTIFLLSLFLSVLAGLYPAWRAARLDPIVALRKE
jgi:putative ABC transport system permease protein